MVAKTPEPAALAPAVAEGRDRQHTPAVEAPAPDVEPAQEAATLDAGGADGKELRQTPAQTLAGIEQAHDPGPDWELP